MNWDAVGAFGCPTPETTPNIDKLASEGIRFNHGHITIAVCQPSRSCMLTGLYPHNSGGEGFFHLRYENISLLPCELQEAGYTAGILGKLDHSSPYIDLGWDMSYDMDDLGHGRNPSLYRKYAADFMKDAVKAGKPFFLMANSHDPHRPFYGNDDPKWYNNENQSKAAIPSKVFTPEEVTVPGFLEDLPEVRLEISEDYSSVRRCDDTVGEILDELGKQGLKDNTLVVFLSDNGMAFPFAKTNCYLNSTRTPMIARWPKVIQNNIIDEEHFLAGVDLMPTFLEAAGITTDIAFDGTSFLPVLQGKEQNREFVFTQFNQTAAKRNYPMRCIQNSQFGYIFNPWSDGKKIFKNESMAGRTFHAMEHAAETDLQIAERVELFLHRVPEEFYDFKNDPDARNNLIDSPDYAEQIATLQNKLEQKMMETGDPMLTAFQNRKCRKNIDSFMENFANEIGGS